MPEITLGPPMRYVPVCVWRDSHQQWYGGPAGWKRDDTGKLPCPIEIEHEEETT